MKKILKNRHERKLSKQCPVSCSFSDSKIEAMKQKARELSKMIVQNSKTIINQHNSTPVTPIESDSNNEHLTKIDILTLQNTVDISKNNNQLEMLVNNERTIKISSDSKNSSETKLTAVNETSNYTFKRKHNKYVHTKHKKSKIPYLVKCDVYQEECVDNLTSKKQDDYVLEKLFNKSGR